MDAFDADVVIYAAVPGHPLGAPVLDLFSKKPSQGPGVVVGVGSTLLVPEVLTKPTRDGADDELTMLFARLGQLDLRPLDEAIASVAVVLGSSYRLRAADAVQLATAVSAGADRFITTNHRDFPQSISEISITYPTDLQ